MSIVLTSALALGVIFSLSDWANAGVLLTLRFSVLLALPLGLVSLWRSPVAGVWLLVVIWVACLVTQLVKADHDAWPTIGVPFAITAVAVMVFRTRRLTAVARSAPLVLPVTLSVLVVPLFTDDLWATAPRLHVRTFILLALLTLVPLLIAVERRLRSEVRAALELAAREPDPDASLGELKETLTRLLPDEERAGARTEIDGLITRYWEPFEPQTVIEEAVEPLRIQLVRSLAATALGLATVATIYMGALAWILIPIANARDWSDAPVEVTTIAAMGVSVDLPTGLYPSVAVLLGLLATAVLLASVAVDEDYARRLAEALLRQPARKALAAAVPYLRMRAADPPKATTAESAGSG